MNNKIEILYFKNGEPKSEIITLSNRLSPLFDDNNFRFGVFLSKDVDILGEWADYVENLQEIYGKNMMIIKVTKTT